MPFCPVCRVEYRQGFTHCIDCRVALVDTLEPLMVHYVDDAEATMICRLTDDYQAGLIVAALQDRGIPVLLQTHEAATGGSAEGETLYNINEIYVPKYLDDEAHEVMGDIVADVLNAPQSPSAADEPSSSDELYTQAGDRPIKYKPIEDKRIKLSVIFGIITAVYVVYLYITLG